MLAYDDEGIRIQVGSMDTFTVADLAPVTGQQLALDGQALDAGTTCDAQLGTVVAEEDICTSVPGDTGARLGSGPERLTT